MTTDTIEKYGIAQVVKKPVLVEDLAVAVRGVLDHR